MTSFEASGRQRDSLPSITHLDFEKYRLDKADRNRFSMPSLNSIAHNNTSSPSTIYSGPPPPYSSAVSAATSAPIMPGHTSSPEPANRRSVWEDKDLHHTATLLPSISEALKSAEIVPPAQQYSTKSTPGSAVAQTFADAPRGPGNPFSQPPLPTSALRSSFSSVPESPIATTVPPPPPPIPSDTRPVAQNILTSPKPHTSTQRISAPFTPANITSEPTHKPSFPTDPARPGYPFPDHPTSASAPTSAHHQSHPFNFEPHNKHEEIRNPFIKSDTIPYNETVKRHLDVYDAELALNEIHDASLQTLDFAKTCSQRYHQANRVSYFNDGLPGISEIDEMIRYSHHILEGLSKLRDVAIMQQNALNEQRARTARGNHAEDDCQRLSDDYKSGGFASGDAKKRRGKAAAPGRCHSCNRAETPEWRRGPDGARTLCNACGLHYAKLTRKMGASKAAVMTGSNLRPKNLGEPRP